jgi:hypothetical protein
VRNSMVVRAAAAASAVAAGARAAAGEVGESPIETPTRLYGVKFAQRAFLGIAGACIVLLSCAVRSCWLQCMTLLLCIASVCRLTSASS